MTYSYKIYKVSYFVQHVNYSVRKFILKTKSPRDFSLNLICYSNMLVYPTVCYVIV